MSSAPGTVNITWQAAGLQKIQSEYDAFLKYVAAHQPATTFGNARTAAGPAAPMSAGSSGVSGTLGLQPSMDAAFSEMNRRSAQREREARQAASQAALTAAQEDFVARGGDPNAFSAGGRRRSSRAQPTREEESHERYVTSMGPAAREEEAYQRYLERGRKRSSRAQTRIAEGMEQQATIVEQEVRSTRSRGGGGELGGWDEQGNFIRGGSYDRKGKYTGGGQGAGRGGGGGGGGSFGGGFIFSPIGAMFAAWELHTAMAGQAKAQLQGALAENMGGVYKAKQAELSAIYSGVLMGGTGLALDVLGSVTGTGIGPTGRREKYQVKEAQEEFRQAARISESEIWAGDYQRRAYQQAAPGGMTSAQREYQRAGIYTAGQKKAEELSGKIQDLADAADPRGTSDVQREALKLNLAKQAMLREQITEVEKQTRFESERFEVMDQQDTKVQQIQLQGQASQAQALAQRNPYLAGIQRINTSLAAAWETAKPELIPGIVAAHAAQRQALEADYAFQSSQSIAASAGAARVSNLLASDLPYSARIQAITEREERRIAAVEEGPRAEAERRGIVNETWAERIAAYADWKRDSLLAGAGLGVQTGMLRAESATNDPLRGLKAQALGTVGSAVMDAYKAQISQHPELIPQILGVGKLELESQRQSYKDRFRAEEAQIGRIATGQGAGADPAEVFKAIEEGLAAIETLLENPTKLIEAIRTLGETK